MLFGFVGCYRDCDAQDGGSKNGPHKETDGDEEMRDEETVIGGQLCRAMPGQVARIRVGLVSVPDST